MNSRLLHHQRRQAGEVRVAPLRIAEVVDRHAAAIGDVQPGLGLFRVGREQPVFGVAHQCRGEVRLAGDGVVAVVQALHERRQQLVAEAAVEGAVRREQDGLAGTLAHLVVQGRGIACQLACLQPRGVRFVKYHDAHRGEDRQGEADQHQALAETAFSRRSGGRRLQGCSSEGSFVDRSDAPMLAPPVAAQFIRTWGKSSCPAATLLSFVQGKSPRRQSDDRGLERRGAGVRVSV